MIREYAVDPDAYTRNRDSLQRFFTDFRAEQGRVVSAIQGDKTRAELQRGLVEHVKPLLPARFEVEMSIWPSNQMHDRFVLTKQVGYSFGHGLDEATYQDAIEVNIHRLAETARHAEYRKFSNTAIRQGEPIVIVGT